MQQNKLNQTLFNGWVDVRMSPERGVGKREYGMIQGLSSDRKWVGLMDALVGGWG